MGPPHHDRRLYHGTELVAVAANPTLMETQTRSERWLDRRIAHAATPRWAAIVIASVTTSITIIAGLLKTIVDHEHFASVGSGLWTVITASITSSLVTRSGREKAAVEDGAPSAEQLRRIAERLERIEAALNKRPGAPV